MFETIKLVGGSKGTRGWIAAVLTVWAMTAPARGHDFWVEPSSYRVTSGQRVSLALREGHGEGLPLPRQDSRIVRFEAYGPDGRVEVPGVDRVDPAGFLPAPADGGWMVVYENTPASYELPAERFESYLEQEGLERASELRAAAGESGEPGREQFSRCAKTLLAVGALPARWGSPDWSQPIGMALELVPDANPYRLAAGGQLGVRLLFAGQPLAGALVRAVPRDAEGAATFEGRSDAEGRVRFPLAAAGRWVVKAVHMERLQPTSSGEEGESGAFWRSWWASLTFELPASEASAEN